MCHIGAQLPLHLGNVCQEGAEQRHSGDDGASYSHALGDGLGSVTYRVEVCHDIAGFLVHPGHLADAVGVVSDGPEGVHGDVVACQRQHADTRHGHAVEHIDGGLAPIDEHRA